MFEEDWINEDYKKRREEGGEGGGEQGFGVWDLHGGWKILFQIGMKWGIIVIAYETLRPGLPHCETTGHCLVFCRLLLLCIYFDSKIKNKNMEELMSKPPNDQMCEGCVHAIIKLMVLSLLLTPDHREEWEVTQEPNVRKNTLFLLPKKCKM